MVDDVKHISILVPVNPTAGKVGPRKSSKGKAPVATVVNEAAVLQRLGVKPAQVTVVWFAACCLSLLVSGE